MTHDKINKKKHSTLIDIFRQKIKTSKAMLIVLFVTVLNEGRSGVCVCVCVCVGGGGGGGRGWSSGTIQAREK